ncbi:MAG: hypothetical protein IJ092_00585 [Atopobiaceae bacterium]|nr:hypothetical protein [Atopobiaceae bacterium]
MKLNKTKGDAGGNVENLAAPKPLTLADNLAATPDPLRQIAMWAASVDEGLIGADDTALLWQLIAQARTEIRSNFVPLALAIEMARSKPEFGDETPDVGNYSTTSDSVPNRGQSSGGGGS